MTSSLSDSGKNINRNSIIAGIIFSRMRNSGGKCIEVKMPRFYLKMLPVLLMGVVLMTSVAQGGPSLSTSSASYFKMFGVANPSANTDPCYEESPSYGLAVSSGNNRLVPLFVSRGRP